MTTDSTVTTQALETITIEQLEALAAQLETDAQAERSKLERLIRAYARIISAREPKLFKRHPLAYCDEDGHCDNSYPPSKEYRDYSGPRLIQVRDCKTDDIATSGGFYHEWKRVTEDPGLFVARDGRIYGCDETGTGRVGRFAAHPGDCNVHVTLEYDVRSEVSTEELRTVEEHLRKLAFPLSQGAAA